MRCSRCGGLKVWEPCVAIDIAMDWRRGAWRCITCGDYLDAVILRHRRTAQGLAATA